MTSFVLLLSERGLEAVPTAVASGAEVVIQLRPNGTATVLKDRHGYAGESVAVVGAAWADEDREAAIMADVRILLEHLADAWWVKAGEAYGRLRDLVSAALGPTDIQP